jgi:hypothetical protein
MEGLRAELQAMFQEFTQQMQQPRRRRRQSPEPEAGRSTSGEDDQTPEFSWNELLQDIPTAPPLAEDSHGKVYKLAEEVKKRAALITAGRDLHDIHTVLHLIGHWNELQPTTQNYAAHRLRLLYVAITKGWPAALFYDQKGADEF